MSNITNSQLFIPSFSESYDDRDDMALSRVALFTKAFGMPVIRYTFSNVVPIDMPELTEGYTDVWIEYFNKNFDMSLEPLVQTYAYRKIAQDDTSDDGIYICHKKQVLILIRMGKLYPAPYFSNPDITVYCNNERNISDFLSFLKKHRNYIPPKTPQVHILAHGPIGFYTREFSIKNPEIDFSLNYNDDFAEIDGIIKNFMGESDESGLILLHGLPGTGKTFYIRHIIKWASEAKDQGDVIYIPSGMGERLADPNFIPFLTGRVGSTIIIEDAERLVKSRDLNYNSGVVSDLLNLSDGILGDAFKLKFLLSFNAQIDEVDTALLRKGRLKAKYEFKELTQEKANGLLKYLGKQGEAKSPMTLTEIFNWEDKSFAKKKEEKAKIGFGR